MHFLVDEGVMQKIRACIAAISSSAKSGMDNSESGLSMRIFREISRITNEIDTSLHSEVVVIPDGHEIAQWYYAHNGQNTNYDLFKIRANPRDDGVIDINVVPDKNHL